MESPTLTTSHSVLVAGLNIISRHGPISSDTFWESTRICTGQHVAENSLWIAIASILASCKISNAVDENGNIIVPESGLTDGLVRQVL
jgi:hypothetical protein